jgi:CheY-like chemotaxis protein
LIIAADAKGVTLGWFRSAIDINLSPRNFGIKGHRAKSHFMPWALVRGISVGEVTYTVRSNLHHAEAALCIELDESVAHELEISLPPRPVFLDADLTRLAQVFSNLLTNSAKYTEPGGRLQLFAERREREISVTVRDNSIGIPENALPHIFDMFSQVDRSVERSSGGLGIGLALVKGIVEMHGGTVSAESAGQGKGSEFNVCLPLIEARPAPSNAGVSDSVPHGPSRRVLVVDDNRDGAASMAMMLRLLGDDVRMANDGLEAVEAFESFRPEVILMDVGMPRLNGLEATRRIREHPSGKSCTIIAVTGWGQDGDVKLSREAGCNGHLVKPVTLADLEKLLSQAHPRVRG